MLLITHASHIVSDGVVTEILVREWRRSKPPSAAARPILAAAGIHYADYAQWQRSWLRAKS